LGKVGLSAENFAASIKTSGNVFSDYVVDAARLTGNTLIDTAINMREILTAKNGLEDFNGVSGGPAFLTDRNNPKKSATEFSDNGRTGSVDLDQFGDKIAEKTVTAGSKFQEIIKDSAIVFANILSGALVSGLGGGANAIRGSNIGSSFATMGGTLLEISSKFIPLLGVAGGLLGGLFGSLFDSEPKQPALIANTEALRANTQALEELGRTVINAPTNFRLPVLNSGGSAGLNIGNITINSASGDPQQIYKTFVKNLERDYSRSINTGYTRGRML
jgi:hypothetical protein